MCWFRLRVSFISRLDLIHLTFHLLPNEQEPIITNLTFFQEHHWTVIVSTAALHSASHQSFKAVFIQ